MTANQIKNKNTGQEHKDDHKLSSYLTVAQNTKEKILLD